MPASSNGPLDNVEACSLLKPNSLPAEWGSFTANPDTLVKLGDSDCDFLGSPGGFVVSIMVYRTASLTQLATMVPPSTDTDLDGQPAKMYRGGSGGTCGILLGVGNTQSVIIAAAPAASSTLDPCDSATVAAQIVAPNLPSS